MDFSGSGPFTSGNDPIAFGPAGGSQGRAFWDLTIVTNGTVAVGNNGFGHGIGINAPFSGPRHMIPYGGYTWNVTTSSGTTIQGGSAGVSDGIWIDSAYQDNTINIQSHGVTIGYAGDAVFNDGIHVNVHFNNSAP